MNRELLIISVFFLEYILGIIDFIEWIVILFKKLIEVLKEFDKWV